MATSPAAPPVLRLRPPAARIAVPAALGLTGAAALLALRPELLPAQPPAWAVWVPCALLALLALHLLARPVVVLEADALMVRRGLVRERFERRAIARVEFARWSRRIEVRVILRGGGVRTLPRGALTDLQGFATSLARRGILVVVN